MTLDLTKCVRGQKLRYRDGTIGTFIAYVPEASFGNQVITYCGNRYYSFHHPSGVYIDDGEERTSDIIGLVETVTYPELWVVRWGTTWSSTNRQEEAERFASNYGLDAIITHLPAVEIEK